MHYKALFFFIVSLLIPTCCQCSIYPLNQGCLYVKGHYLRYETDHFWNSDGKKRDAFNNFEMGAGELTIAYGLTSCDTLWAKDYYARIDESLNGRAIGFGDAEFGWTRYLCCWKDHSISGELVAIIPVGDEKENLRYGKWGVEGSLLASRCFPVFNQWAWYDVQLGYRWYEGYPADQIRARFNLGLQYCRFQIVSKTKLDYGLNNGDSKFSQTLFLWDPNYRLIRTDIELTWNICRYFDIHGGYFWHVWGRNVGTGDGYYGGLSLCF